MKKIRKVLLGDVKFLMKFKIKTHLPISFLSNNLKFSEQSNNIAGRLPKKAAIAS